MLSWMLASIRSSLAFQRLANISQMGVCGKVYPWIKTTRKTHSEMVARCVENVCQDLPREDVELLSAAALLHDIGHGPYSHVLERAFPWFHHEKVTHALVPYLVPKDLVDPILSLLNGEGTLGPLINGDFDLDKLAYVWHDFTVFTGVPGRLLNNDTPRVRIDPVLGPVWPTNSKDLIVQTLQLRRWLHTTLYQNPLVLAHELALVQTLREDKDLIVTLERACERPDLYCQLRENKTTKPLSIVGNGVETNGVETIQLHVKIPGLQAHVNLEDGPLTFNEPPTLQTHHFAYLSE